MKFLNLCFFTLICFFTMGFSEIKRSEIPEEDLPYLQQEEDDNGYGCTDFESSGGRSFQNADGSWTDIPLQRRCEEYCRPAKAADRLEDDDIFVECRASYFHRDSDNGPAGGGAFTCSGFGKTLEQAKSEAQSICHYKLRSDYPNAENKKVSCDHSIICFEIL